MHSLANLEKLATKRRELTSEDSECIVYVDLSGGVSVWNMDRQEIKQATKNKRCDFAVRQDKNPNDGKSYLVLLECKRNFREEDIDHIHKQIESGLKVLNHLAGGKENFPLDILSPVWVVKDYPGVVPFEILHRFPVKYHDGRKTRKAHIRIANSGISITDNYVAIKVGKRRHNC